MPRKKVLFVELQQETNSFSPLRTTLRDFSNLILLYGEEVEPVARRTKYQLRGFYEAWDRHGRADIEIVPVFSAWATSGGPLTPETWRHFLDVFETALRQHPDAAGIYLSLHGAMAVEGLTDAEGELLAWLRERVGPALPVGVSLDLHANLTRRMAEGATFILAYHTNPHRDHVRLGYESAKLLFETVRGTVQPVMAWRKLPMLKGGGFNIDFLAPTRGVFRRMAAMEKRPNVLGVATLMVHIWLDDPELGWSVVVVTDGDRALAERLADELADLNWAVRHHRHPEPDTPESALARLRRQRWRTRLGTAVFCDASDAVAAGAPGENTHLLKTLAEQAPDLTTYIPLRDEAAVAELYDKPLGSAWSGTLGGRLETRFNAPLPFEGTVVSRHELRESGPVVKETGRVVVLRRAGTHVVLTDRGNPVFRPSFFTGLGLSLWRADAVVVKNLFPFRYFFLPYNRLTLNVVTPGVTDVDVFRLGYARIPRPIFPLDAVEDWR